MTKRAPAQWHGADMKEFDLQKFVVALLRFSGVPALLWYAVPNGEARSKRTGAKLKAMGVKAGVADFAITLPGGRQHFLELKTAASALSASQRAFRALCEANGTPYAVARSSGEAETILASWGALRSAERRVA